jgi:TnpA family transposase
MARRKLLNDVQWAGSLLPPTDEREIVRHYTLSDEDLAVVAGKRGDHNRIGFALTLCYLRFPGRALGIGETPPLPLIRFVAKQLGVEPEAFAAYARRDQTRRGHLAELSHTLGCKAFKRSELKALTGWLAPMAHKPRTPEQLVPMLIDELRRRRILLPTAAVLEMIVHQARTRAESTLHRALIEGLGTATRASLDRLLDKRPEETLSYLAWLRSAQQSPAARNLLGLAERVRFVRTLGVDRMRRQDIPAQAFERLADEGLRMTAQRLRDLRAPRRHAVLCATVIKLESLLTDAVLCMFDKLMGSVARKASRRNDERTLQSARDLRTRIQALTRACRAVIAARESGTDPFAAIDEDVGWQTFVRAVADAEVFAAPMVDGNKAELIERYPSVRAFAPTLLETFKFRGTSPVASLLKGIEAVAEMYRNGKRSLPENPPTGFIRKSWRPLVFDGEKIDRKAYVLCALSELRDRLRAGDVWVDGSRQYQDFESYLMPKATFSLLKAEGPLPLAIETDADRYLAGRRDALERELSAVGQLAEEGGLQEVEIADGDIKITPLRAVTPPEAAALKDQAYELLPRVKITGLLQEVDRWTGFSDCFTHQRSGRPPEDKSVLLSAILADGINLGLTRMAEVCRGVTLRQLAWVHDWHVQEESYAAALVRLIEAHRVLPLAKVWGSGTTSSSDGQYFRAGGRGEALADINARHGNEPGIAFYTHISDQFGPFYTKVIAATASEAPHVLDGLLYHQTGLQIEEHYSDTGGVTDHVFGLCHLFGFRFAPRIRDLKDRRLYVFPNMVQPTRLQPIIAGTINVDHVRAHWEELLRLAVSIRSGTSSASAMLKRLSAYPRQNGLAVALREIGRIERSLFTMDWLKSPELRRRAHAGLNKGEARNALARAIFFHSLGELRDRTFENQFFRASGLNLLVAAVILWNTKYLERALAALQPQLQVIPHVTPLGWEHISLTGDYIWADDAAPVDGSLRPLRAKPSLLAA